MNLSVISISLSIAVAVASAISPIVVAILNNRYQLKLKRIELDQQHFERTVMHKREIIEEYLRATGAFLSSPDDATKPTYGEYYFKALLYVPDELRKQMVSMHQHIGSNEYPEASKILENIIPQLEELLREL